jgi:hypothetical protein
MDAITNRDVKADKFRDLAEKRVSKAIKAIRIIKHLAGPNYHYTADQANKMFKAIRSELDAVEAAYRPKQHPAEFQFD